MTLDFTKHDLINLALAMSASASSAYCDERLTTSATEHQLAARFWYAAGYDAKALHHRMLAQAIDAEMIEMAEAA